MTKKADFGKLHWNLFGKDADGRNLPTQDGGGQISWTGPDSSRLEFNVRRDSEDEGFQSYMQGGTLVVKNAYVVGEEIRNDSFENDNYSVEDPIPVSYTHLTLPTSDLV